MKVLEIHEVKEEYLRKEYYSSFDLLTFDDGLYSQFYYRDFFANLGKPLIYFVSSGILRTTGSPSFKSPLQAHNDFFTFKDSSAYMTLEELKLLKGEVQYHLHFHPYLKQYHGVKRMQIIMNEVNLSKSFISEFNCSKFCYPYNYKDDFLTWNLKKLGFTEFYGPGRLNFEETILNQPQINPKIIKGYYK